MNCRIIRTFSRKFSRKYLNRRNIKRLKNTDFSLITANCIGGVISHDLGLRFLSPTVNLFFMPEDYLKFCESLREYTALPLVEIEPPNGEKYPCGSLGDITVYGMHYKTFEEFEHKWRERCERINFDNLYFAMSRRDNCTEDLVKRFDNLPHKNKVIFVDRPMPEIKSAFYIKGTESKNEKDSIINVLEYKGEYTGKRYIDDFDYVSFLNNR